jgi:uncharacterized membrane protein
MMIRLRIVLLVAVIFGSGCAVSNSSSSDSTQYVEAVIEIAGDNNFSPAFAVIQNRCASCHNHTSWNNLTSNALWQASGYVIKGSPSTSVLITNTYRNGTGNMPPSNTLTQAEFDLLKTWISNMP